MSELKTIKVVAAVIVRGGKIYATQRGYGNYKDGWEFPGGKVEPHENPEQALTREIKEELLADIEVGEKLITVEHDYEDFHLSMDCFFATLKNDEDPVLTEHEAARWLTQDELNEVNWLPADIKVVEAILRCHTTFT